MQVNNSSTVTIYTAVNPGAELALNCWGGGGLSQKCVLIVFIMVINYVLIKEAIQYYTMNYEGTI